MGKSSRCAAVTRASPLETTILLFERHTTMPSSLCSEPSPCVAIIGGGPAGLMAAEVLSQAGVAVHVFDAMASVGRKFLLAGIGGLNLTLGEGLSAFKTRFGAGQALVEPWLQSMGPAQVRDWAQGLGIETFVGSSGRVFPRDLKAAPLLRAWLHRLRAAGVEFHTRHRWIGWADGLSGSAPPGLRFQTPNGEVEVHPRQAVVLALGGASWPRLGSDGAWVPWLREKGVQVARLQPANCGFDVAHPDTEGSWHAGWTPHLTSRFAGAPLKNIALRVLEPKSGTLLFEQAGEAVVTQTGLEGSLVYAASGCIRELLSSGDRVVVHIDLLPQREAQWVLREVSHARGSRSLATHLKSRLGIDGVKAALLYEALTKDAIHNPVQLAQSIKALPMTLAAPRPIEEAISTAGGVAFESLDQQAMLHALHGVFVAGEMIDWDAPTGGYLLTACLASGMYAGRGVLSHLAKL